MTEEVFRERFGEVINGDLIVMPDGSFVPLTTMLDVLKDLPDDADYGALVNKTETAGYKPLWDKLRELGVFKQTQQ